MTSHTIEIRKANLNDLSQLHKIGIQTFTETFAEHNTADDLSKYIKDSFSNDKIKLELSNEQSIFYLAIDNEMVIGYLKINTGDAQTEIQDSQTLEIERIYVLKEFHGKKVGQLLYEKAIQIATGLKVNYIWLGVWEQNLRALQFYKKNGFLAFDKHMFKLGNDEQIDIMMKLALNNG